MHKAANDNIMNQDSAAKTPVRGRPCPICGKPAVADVRPFCSKRCADVDLHRWLGGTYSIPAAEADDPTADEPAD